MELQVNSLKIIITFTAQQFNSAVGAQFISFAQAINVSVDSLQRGGQWDTQVKHLDST